MNLIEWFDPYNKDHIKAYKHLQDTGIWPVNFLPENIEIPTYWSILVTGKIADAWIKHVLEGAD